MSTRVPARDTRTPNDEGEGGQPDRGAGYSVVTSHATPTIVDRSA